MNFSTLFSKVKNIQKIDDSVVTSLYVLSQRSLPVFLIFSALFTVALYPILHFSIISWFLIITVVILCRLYMAKTYINNRNKYSSTVWYQIFVVLTLLSIIVFSSIGYFFIYYVDDYYKLFIIASLLGLSLGATSSLAPDIRLNIIYISIVIIPVMVTTFFLSDMPIHGILSISLILYYFAQVNYTLKVYKQFSEFETLELQQTFLHSLFENSPLGVFTYNKNFNVTDCNDPLAKLFHHNKEDIVGLNLKNLPDSRPLMLLENAQLDALGTYNGPYTSLQGDYFWIEVKIFPFSNSHGGMGIIEDKTKEHNAIEKLEHMVKHDPLTGLLNRRGFKKYINDLVENINHQEYYSILFYLDLNQFKAINDSLGHAVGDDILLGVSKRLQNTLTKGCMVSRLGGDEFIVIVSYVSKNLDSVKVEANEYSQLLQNVFSESFVINDTPLQIRASIGIVFIEPKYTNTEEILRHADLTMYQAKNQKLAISYYNSSLDKKQRELFLLQQNLGYAAQNSQFELYFQPIVKMSNEQLHAAELLLRWNHPRKGLLSPEEFIPLAINVGLLSNITWWLVDGVCKQIAQWKKDGLWKLEYISINISPHQLIEHNFSTDFLKKLEHYGIETSEIMLEITERSLIDNFSNTLGVINNLKSHGVKCAIDDFGTGYSSLSYLKKLSFHTLKIDRTFVKDIGKSPKELILINTILDIGRLFHYNIIIEGIESKEQKEALLELDSELSYQGYLYSKPIKGDAFTKKFLT